MIPTPTKKEIASSFEKGEIVKANGPICVRTKNATHVRDLAAAIKGDPDPWHSFSTKDELIEIASASYRSLYWDDRKIEGGDVPLIDSIMSSLPSPDHRHSPKGHKARLDCGKKALELRDAHLRAAVMTYVDGWAAVSEISYLLDYSEEGLLYESPSEEIEARILVVTCPSTGRVYGHLVPRNCSSAAQARRWMMGLNKNAKAPEIET